MTIRWGLALVVFLVSAVASPAAPVGLRHLSADAAETLPSQASQGKPRASPGSAAEKKGLLHLRGTLVEGGAECQRFRATNNKFYTLAGNLRGFRTGDTVEITGKIPKASHCMQDTTIEIQTIRRAKPANPPATHKPKNPGTTEWPFRPGPLRAKVGAQGICG